MRLCREAGQAELVRSQETLKEQTMRTTLKIGGMSCEHCVKAVKTALEEVAGVRSAKVSLKDNSALVDHGDGVTLAALKAAVEEAGYEAA
jgi:copper chaperone CopZ